MRSYVVSLVVGLTLIILTFPLLIAFIVSLFLDDTVVAIRAFVLPLFLSASLGYILYHHSKRRDVSKKVRDREAFAAVALGWPVVVAIGALPYWFGGVFWGPFNSSPGFFDLIRGLVNSWFESMSGFTTTGATVISTRSSPVWPSLPPCGWSTSSRTCGRLCECGKRGARRGRASRT